MESDESALTPPTALSQSRGESSSRAPSVRRQETKDSEKAGRVWAREAEEDPWAPCILTLDGGGIRGYSSLLILKALMHEIWLWELRLDDEERSSKNVDRDVGATVDSESEVAAPVLGDMQQDPALTRFTTKEEELLPCLYFDFMYGTSTGGLIATILGRLRMTVPEGLELYRKVGDDLFGNRRSYVPLVTKYHHEPLEKAVRDIISKRCQEHEHCVGDDMHPWESDRMEEILQQAVPFDVNQSRVCQSCVLTATHNANISEAYLLRTYCHVYGPATPNYITRYNEGADLLPIYQVTRATTAAPFYFEHVQAIVNGVEMAFKDGGIRENNPSGAALSEFHALYEGTGIKTPALMLSVGTGRPDTSQDGFASAWPGPFNKMPFVSKFLEKRAVIQNVLIKYTEGEKQHHFLREYAHGEATWYKRLNVSEGLENMALDDWAKGDWHGENVAGGASLTRMEGATEKYLEREFDDKVDSYAPPKIMLEQAAEKLVRQRRARERMGGERYEALLGKHLISRQRIGNGAAG